MFFQITWRCNGTKVESVESLPTTVWCISGHDCKLRRTTHTSRWFERIEASSETMTQFIDNKNLFFCVVGFFCFFFKKQNKLGPIFKRAWGPFWGFFFWQKTKPLTRVS